jgi:hypothetical protein
MYTFFIISILRAFLCVYLSVFIFVVKNYYMQYDVKALDCDKMRIHPNSPQLVKFMEENIPKLGSVDYEWKKGFTKAMVYRYIILQYDPNSPIQSMHSLDWYSKKFESAAYAGFELKKSRDGHTRFEDRVLDMVIGKDEKIADMVIFVLAWMNNTRWNHLVYLQESLMQYTHDVLSGVKQDSKERKEVRLIYDEIKKVSNEVGHVFEETEEFVSRFYYQIEQSRLALRPEDYAKGLANGDDLRADSPYGVGYVVDKIKFVGDHVPEL